MNTATAPPAVVAPAPRRLGAKRMLLLTLGGLTVLIALVLLAGGGIGVWALGERDGSGYFTSGTHKLSTPTYALSSDTVKVNSDVPGWFGDRFATARVQASSPRPFFIGIARTSDIDHYLAGVRHEQIHDFDLDPFTVSSRIVAGSAVPAPPARQAFWRAHASGKGTQTIEWPLEKGDWSAVVMNTDASHGVSVDARFGGRVSALGWIVFALLAAGALVLLAGAALLYRTLQYE
jgi:hypothetical protein